MHPNDLPIIGQAFKILLNYPTVLIQCQCPAKPTMVLIGAQNVGHCPACQNSYVIVEDHGQRVSQVTAPALVTQ